MEAGGHALRGAAFAACAIALAVVMSGCDDEEALGHHRVSLSQNPAPAGAQVDFSARIRTFEDEKNDNDLDDLMPVERDRVNFLWDLDGDGNFETRSPTELVDGSSAPQASDFTTSVSRSYPEPRTLVVSSLTSLQGSGLGVIGGEYLGAGDRSVETQTLTVTDEPVPPPEDVTPSPTNQRPFASFTVTPNVPKPEERFLLDASSSSDPDGSIVRYEWDLDQTPGYERNTGTTPTTTHFFNAAGTYPVGLRITDSSGATATTTRSVIVRHPPETARVARRAAGLSRFELEPDGRSVNDGVYTLNGDELILSSAKARGTLAAKPFPRSLRGSRDVRWAADSVLTMDADTGEGEAEAFVLLTFATGGRACVGATVSGVGTDDPEGRFRVIGAIGKAARLHGLGTVSERAGGDGRPVLSGRGRFRLGEKAEFGLGKSRCGPLRRLAPRRD